MLITYMSVIFPTLFHEIASKKYNHIANSRDDAAFILERVTQGNLGQFCAVYLRETQFTRFITLQKCWDDFFPEEPLSGLQVDMLIYMLDEYLRSKALKARALKLEQGHLL